MIEEMENTSGVPVDESIEVIDASKAVSEPATVKADAPVNGMSKSGLNNNEVVTRTLGLPD